jgi:hypothetical protein
VPEPNTSEFEVPIGKLKSCRSPGDGSDSSKTDSSRGGNIAFSDPQAYYLHLEQRIASPVESIAIPINKKGNKAD